MFKPKILYFNNILSILDTGYFFLNFYIRSYIQSNIYKLLISIFKVKYKIWEKFFKTFDRKKKNLPIFTLIN